MKNCTRLIKVSTKMSVKKKARKQRLVKNAIVDLDSVTIDSGDEYRNWVPITKDKLKVGCTLSSPSHFLSIHD